TPIAITKVVFPDGRVDNNWGKPHRVRALSEAVAATETSILHQNVLSGTAVRSAVSCPSAAKTGTTEELVDAWLDGYTPDYSTVVWMGYPNKRVSMTSVHGEPQQGGHLPAVIWHDYMSAVLEGQSCVQFPSANESISYRPFYGKYATTGHSEYVAPTPLGPPPGPSSKGKGGQLGGGPQEAGGAPPAGPPAPAGPQATPPGHLKHGGGGPKTGGAGPH